MNTQRLFGLLGMLCSPCFLVYVLTTGMNESTLLGAILGLLFQFGCLCSVLGLYVTRAAGDSAISKGILYFQMTLHTLAMLLQVLEYQQIGLDSVFYLITDIAWPLGFLFMLVTGGAVIRAQRWLGWRRFLPLLCALPLPLTMASGAVIGMDLAGYLFGSGLLLIYLLLAFAVFRYNAEEATVMTPQPSF